MTTALACMALSGCAGGMSSAYSGSFWVQPGKYEFIKCPDIQQRMIGSTDRERKLVSLMERANQDTAGPLINIMVYQAQLEQTRADINELQQAAHAKNCGNIVPTPKK